MKSDRQRFFICEHCGNMIGFLNFSGVPVVCCGENMKELVPNTMDASAEKHVPVIKVDGNIVTVEIGTAPHPMIEKHFIEWVYIQTAKGGQRKVLLPNNQPSVQFALTDDDNMEAAYAYCNLHGLWKATVE